MCLDQCLALCWILRRRQIAAELVIGVYKFPFTAHAWLECGGKIIQWQAGLHDVEGIKALRSMAVILRFGGADASKKPECA